MCVCIYCIYIYIYSIYRYIYICCCFFHHHLIIKGKLKNHWHISAAHRIQASHIEHDIAQTTSKFNQIQVVKMFNLNVFNLKLVNDLFYEAMNDLNPEVSPFLLVQNILQRILLAQNMNVLNVM